MKRINPIKPNTYTLNTYEHIRCGQWNSTVSLFLCSLHEKTGKLKREWRASPALFKVQTYVLSPQQLNHYRITTILVYLFDIKLLSAAPLFTRGHHRGQIYVFDLADFEASYSS